MPVWTNTVLKLDTKTIGLQGSPTQVRRIFAPEREKGEIIPGEGENKKQAVEIMFDKLVDWDFASTES
jgi:electron transfer flavoprotein beta subunit